MNLSNEVIKLIDEIAKRLQIPFDKAIEIATKQLRYMVVMDWIWIVASVAVVAFTAMMCIKISKQLDDYEGFWYQNDTLAGLTIATLAVLSIIGIIGCFFVVPQLIQIAVNPDYAIIEIIKNMVR